MSVHPAVVLIESSCNYLLGWIPRVEHLIVLTCRGLGHIDIIVRPILWPVLGRKNHLKRKDHKLINTLHPDPAIAKHRHHLLRKAESAAGKSQAKHVAPR